MAITDIIRTTSKEGTSKYKVLKFLRPASNSIFYCHNLKDIKLLTRLCLIFSQPSDHEFKHQFQDTFTTLFAVVVLTLNLLTIISFNMSTVLWKDNPLVRNKISDTNEDILKQDEEIFVRTLIFSISNFSMFKYANILNPTVEYILVTKRFDGLLL